MSDRPYIELYEEDDQIHVYFSYQPTADQIRVDGDDEDAQQAKAALLNNPTHRCLTLAPHYDFSAIEPMFWPKGSPRVARRFRVFTTDDRLGYCIRTQRRTYSFGTVFSFLPILCVPEALLASQQIPAEVSLFSDIGIQVSQKEMDSEPPADDPRALVRDFSMVLVLTAPEPLTIDCRSN